MEESKSYRFRILNDDNILFGVNCIFNCPFFLSILTLSLTPSLLPFIWVFLSVFSSIPRADRWDISSLSLRFFVCLISLALCCAFVFRSFSQIQCQVSLSVLNKSFSLFFTLSCLEGIKSSFTLPTQTPFNKNSLTLSMKSDKIPSIPEDEAERVCERKISAVVMRGQLWGLLAAFDTPFYFAKANSTEKTDFLKICHRQLL